VRHGIVETAKGIATVIGMTLGGILFFALVAGSLLVLTIIWHLVMG